MAWIKRLKYVESNMEGQKAMPTTEESRDAGELEKQLIQHASAAYSLALSIVGSASDAEDACQDAFLRAIRDFSRTQPSSFKTWLLVLVRNSAVSLVRSRKVRRWWCKEMAAPKIDTTAEPSSSNERELAATVQGALASLEDRFRLPVLLHYQQGLSYSEVAEVLQQPQGTVASNISRGIDKLRHSLERSGFSVSSPALSIVLLGTAPHVPKSLLSGLSQLSALHATAASPSTVLGTKSQTVFNGGFVMKVGLGIAVALIIAEIAIGTIGANSVPQGGVVAEEPKPAKPALDLNNLPDVVPDESSDDWVVDRFAGNSTTGGVFYQGPAREVGGLGRAWTTPLPDGTVYVGCEAGLAELGSDGILRLVMGADGALEGPIEQCAAGEPIWNSKENALYLTGTRCLRKVIEKPDGSKWVEIVAGISGEEPGNSGPKDGPAKSATFPLNCRGWVCNSKGIFYRLEVYHGLRKLENGVVSRVALNFVDEPKGFEIHLGGNLSLGDNDDLYVADHWNFVVRRIDLKTGDVRNVALMPKVKHETMPLVHWERCNRNKDGPALTHASSNSGCAFVVYDPFHKAIWLGGPDENRVRWFKDGWVKTVIGKANGGCEASGRWLCNSLGTPAEKANIMWNSVCGVDGKGGVFLNGSGLPHGVWRAYNRKEVKP